MNNDILVSIIVPVYNVEKYLERCLKSIINQTYSNIEIILIIDPSTDKSGEICRKFKEEDRRIILIEGNNEGLSVARNIGLKIARGGYIAFIDSDDYVSDKYIEILLGLCLRNDADIAQCSCVEGISDECEFDEEVNKEEIYSGIEYLRDCYDHEVVWDKLYKAEIFEGIEFPVGRIFEEMATVYKLEYRAEKIACISNGLYYYFQSSNSIMRRKFDLSKLDALKAFEERAEFFFEIGERRLYECEQRDYDACLLELYYRVKKYYPEEKEILRELHGKICRTYKILKKLKSPEMGMRAKICAFAGTYMPYFIGMIYDRMNI